MDLLYSRYSNPMDLMKRYINQRRFGTFVQSFIEAEAERRKQENDNKLWDIFVHSYGYLEHSFSEWKKQISQPGSTTPTGKSDADLNDDGIKAIFDDLFD